MSHRKLALYLAGATAAVMVVMAVLGLTTGTTQELHEHVALPEIYGFGLIEQRGSLRAMMGLDLAFCVLYTAYFAALAAYLRERGASRVLVWIGLGAILLTALLDFVEDQHILVLLDLAEKKVLPSTGAIAFQAVESGTKFAVSFVGLVCFGLAIPRDNRLALALSVLLVLGTLISAVLTYAAPPRSMVMLEVCRFAGFLVGFALAIAWLRGAPEPAATPH